jgi:flagellar export protein FliJ
MKKFNFQFQTVLRVRKIQEMEFLRQLARTQRAHQEELIKRSQLDVLLEKSLKRRENLGQTDEDVASFYLEDNFIIGTKQKIIQADRDILRASKAVARALQVYVSAKRQSKVIETLLERAQTEHRRMLKKKEEKDLDELVVIRNRLSKDGYEIDSNE